MPKRLLCKTFFYKGMKNAVNPTSFTLSNAPSRQTKITMKNQKNGFLKLYNELGEVKFSAQYQLI